MWVLRSCSLFIWCLLQNLPCPVHPEDDCHISPQIHIDHANPLCNSIPAPHFLKNNIYPSEFGIQHLLQYDQHLSNPTFHLSSREIYFCSQMNLLSAVHAPSFLISFLCLFFHFASPDFCFLNLMRVVILTANATGIHQDELMHSDICQHLSG